MGEYYDWVNVDKDQYLVPMEFRHGSKRFESCTRHAEVLGALYSLLSREWKGDHIIFLGDEAEIPENPQNETLRILRQKVLAVPEGGMDGYTLDRCTCVSGLFKAAETEVREEIGLIIEGGCHNWYGINIENPYKGLFERDWRFFRYVVNHDKKEYYDTDNVYWKDTDMLMDPLPLLLIYGRMTENEKRAGRWLGDRIAATDQMPGDEYTDISASRCWEDVK